MRRRKPATLAALIALVAVLLLALAYFGKLPLYTAGSNCNSYFGPELGQCEKRTSTESYGSATANAYARMSVVYPLAGAAGVYARQPDYVYDGREYYVGDLEVKYACDGDKVYARPGNLGWYSCNDDGCSGEPLASQIGTYTVRAPKASIPQLRFQCWDYNKKTATDGSWAFAWTWAGLQYDSIDASLVTSVPDTDSDGVLDNADLCPRTPSADHVNSAGCTTVAPPVTPPTTPPIDNTPDAHWYDWIVNIIRAIEGWFA